MTSLPSCGKSTCVLHPCSERVILQRVLSIQLEQDVVQSIRGGASRVLFDSGDFRRCWSSESRMTRRATACWLWINQQTQRCPWRLSEINCDISRDRHFDRLQIITKWYCNRCQAWNRMSVNKQRALWTSLLQFSIGAARWSPSYELWSRFSKPNRNSSASRRVGSLYRNT
jgi:hypothetical protein